MKASEVEATTATARATATGAEFTLPAGIKFGASAFTNAASTQTINIYVDGQLKAQFIGSGTQMKDLGTKVIDSGKGAVRVTVTVDGRLCEFASAQLVLCNKLNFALVGTEDGPDKDFNDSLVMMNWPLG